MEKVIVVGHCFEFLGGVTERVVFDNTTLVVKKVFKGTDREECKDFHGFRGVYPFHADYCAPRKGWEKGTVERGDRYIRDLYFRPRPEASTLDELKRQLLEELKRDPDLRTLATGEAVRTVFEAERAELRPLTHHAPETCLTESRVVNRFGHVRVDKNDYSVPIEYAYQDAWDKN